MNVLLAQQLGWHLKQIYFSKIAPLLLISQFGILHFKNLLHQTKLIHIFQHEARFLSRLCQPFGKFLHVVQMENRIQMKNKSGAFIPYLPFNLQY